MAGLAKSSALMPVVSLGKAVHVVESERPEATHPQGRDFLGPKAPGFSVTLRNTQ
jgi:hypothetical protein